MVSRDELDKAVAEAGLDVATGAAATLAGIALGTNPVVATVVGASGPAIKFVQKISARALNRREDRAARTVEKAAKILDVGLDIFEERATSHDARLELLARILEAAARAPLEEKIEALSRVLAEGLREDGSVGEAFVLAAALADLEAPHIVVLEYVADNPVPPKSTWATETAPRGWDAAHVAKRLPALADVLDGLIAVLVGHGLLRDQGDGTWEGIAASSMYAATPLGRRCLLLLGHEISVPEDRPV